MTRIGDIIIQPLQPLLCHVEYDAYARQAMLTLSQNGYFIPLS